MNRCILTLLSLTLCVASIFSAKVEKVIIHSQTMQKNILAIIVIPDSYAKDKKYPVFYLLHGYSGDYTNWGNADEVKTIADRHDMIVVCPDGGYSSWYFDSPIDAGSQYETYISKEVVAWVDNHYRTIPSREGRAISGISMGGHGALYLAFRHQDVFGVCGSMSGGVDIRPFPNSWEIFKKIGAQSQFPERWEKNTVMGLLHLLTPGGLKIILDCGTDDFFYGVNKNLHEALLYRKIPHEFISRPGVHDWNYWKNAVFFQALFFSQYFRESLAEKTAN